MRRESFQEPFYFVTSAPRAFSIQNGLFVACLSPCLRLYLPPSFVFQLSATYPSLAQLESEADSVAQILNRRCQSVTDDSPMRDEAGAVVTADAVIRVPGAFSAEPELRRRAAAAAKKLTPEEERALRASEVQRAVSCRDAPSVPAAAAPGSDETIEHAGDAEQTSAISVAIAALSREGRSRGESGVGHEDGCSRRRRVKAAPGVLAFLTKEYGERAATAARGSTRTVVPHAGAALGSETKEAGDVLPAVAAGAEGPGLSSAAGTSRRGPKIPPPPIKPMSKSLAALVAQSNASKMSGSTGDGRAPGSRKAALPSLGFLDELKARGKRKEAPVDMASESSGAGVSGGVGGESGARGGVSSREAFKKGNGSGKVAAAGAAVSFLDELKARTAVIS